MIFMSGVSFSFPFFQLLMTQVFHDIISPMSALATGMSFICSLGKNGQNIQEEASLVELVDSARQQLQHRLVFFRTLVGRYESFSQGELLKEISGYLKECKMSIEAIPPTFSAGIFVALCCWLCRQFLGEFSMKNTSHEKGKWAFVVSGPLRNLEFREDDIVMEGDAPNHPQESYAYYLYYLTKKEGLSVKIERTTNALSVFFLHKKNIP